MKHNIYVMSKQNAYAYSQDEFIPPTIIVSINDDFSSVPNFPDNPSILDICYSYFADEEDGPEAMTDEDAKAIVDFLANWIDQDVDIVVHCGAGVSRSAGTAAAIMLMLNGDDSLIFGSAQYAPNMNCYRRMLNAAGMYLSEDEVQQKYDQQLELWREAARENGLID